MWEEKDDEELDFDDELDFEEEPEESNQKITINLPKPHKGQEKVIKSKARFRVLLCGRRWGKTLVSMIISIHSMLKKERIAYVVPEYGLAKDFFKDLLNYLPKEVIKVYNKSELYIELIGGGSLKFFSGENLEAFRGRKFNLIIIDEAAFISDLQNAWYSAMRPTLSDLQGKALFISTPRGRNFFYSLYLKGKNKEANFESFHFKTSDNPYFPKGEFEEARPTYPAAKFAEEFLAIPDENSSNPFGTENIQKNVITELSLKPTVIYGIDVASHSDWSVIIGLDEDGSMSYFNRFKTSWEDTKNQILLLPPDTLKVIDATGVGDVLYESLTLERTNIQAFKFSAQSKTAIVNQLMAAVQQGTVKYNETTAQEMQTFEAKRTSTGYVKYEAAAGYHDDCIMSLAMAYHFKQHIYSNNQWHLYTA